MKKLEGWEYTKGARPIRVREYGLQGQEIWYHLINLGFVNKDKLSVREEKLKNWLIWGYWEKNRF
jgi:hypothetical protein